MSWNWDFTWRLLPDLLEGLKVTVQITLLGSVIAMALGLVFATLRYSRIPILSHVISGAVQFIRGTPLLVQIYFLYFVLPKYGVKYSPLVTGTVAIGVNYSAYTAEVYRAGIESVPRGQWEATTALGLPWRRRWGAIVLPQAIRPVIPSLGNYVISMFKDSAILSAITVVEVFNTATEIGSDTFRYLEPITIAGLLYLAVSYPSARLIRRLETRLAHPN